MSEFVEELFVRDGVVCFGEIDVDGEGGVLRFDVFMEFVNNGL